MQRPERSRRTFLGTTAVAAGTALAGCLLPRGNLASGTPSKLTFEDVDEQFRTRTEAVYERVAEMMDAAVTDETAIELIDTAEMQEIAVGMGLTGETTTQQLAHRALGLVDDLEPELPFEFAGAYFPGSRTITFVGEDGDDIDDQLIAHELCHAIQFQSSDVGSLNRTWSAGFDRYNAKQALVEGTAQYVEDEYVGGCDGHFSECHIGGPRAAGLSRVDPALLLAFGAYINGHEFAAALADRNGWDAIWDAHATPPVSTGQILHPEWYPDREPEPIESPSHPSDRWSTLDTEQLGMQSLFVTLWNEGVLPEESIYTNGDDETDEVFSSLVRYRAPVSDAWRGDAFTAFRRSDGRHGWRWQLRFSDSSAAETSFEYFSEWAEARGDRTSAGDVWERTDRYLTLAMDGDELIVAMAPEVDELDAIASTN